jgi:hypothetical protein
MALFTIGLLTASRCGSVLSDPLRITIPIEELGNALAFTTTARQGWQSTRRQGVENPFEEKKCLTVAVAEEVINSGDKKRITR